MSFPALHPGIVLPFIEHIPSDGGGEWTFLPKICEWIAFILGLITVTDDVIFIRFAESEVWNKPLPNPTFIPAGVQFMFVILPMIKIAGNSDRGGIGCPHTEIHPPHVVNVNRMRAELFIKTIIRSCLVVSYVLFSK